MVPIDSDTTKLLEAFRKAALEVVSASSPKPPGKATNPRETEYSQLKKQVKRVTLAGTGLVGLAQALTPAVADLCSTWRSQVALDHSDRAATSAANGRPRRGVKGRLTAQTQSALHQLEAAARLVPDFRPPRPSRKEETAAAPLPVAAEVGEAFLLRNLPRLESLSAIDMPGLAQRALDERQVRLQIMEETLRQLSESRSDVEQRRIDFANLIAAYDWRVEHRERRDFVGPMTLEHTPTLTKLLLGSERLLQLEYPTGGELLAALNAERSAQDAAAIALWPSLLEFVVKEQIAFRYASWPAIARWAAACKPAVSKATVLYCLGMLSAHLLSKDHRLSFDPPALSQQAESVVLPRFDKPGTPDKVFAIFIQGPPLVETASERS